MKAYKELIDAASCLWRLEKHRKSYGKSYTILKGGKMLDYDEAM